MAEKLVYRKKELQKLQEAYQALDQNGLQIRFIVGEAGTGKTVLLEQFLREVAQQEEGGLITGCSCTMAGENGEEYQPFKDILQEIVREIGTEQEGRKNKKEKWKQIFGTSADVLLKVAPDLIENFVPMGTLITSIGNKVVEESGIQQRIDKMKAGSGLLPDLIKLTDQYVEVLKMIAGRYKLVVYIDNLQWADRASLELLQRLQAVLKRLPLLLIGVYRSADVVYATGEGRCPLETFVTHIKVAYGDIIVDLDRGNRNEKTELTEGLLGLGGVKAGWKFREEMLRKTGGNPLFISELVRVLKENGSLVREDEYWKEGEWINWQVCPVRIEGVIREKVAALEAEKAELLACAAVQGQCFYMQVLARMAGKTEIELLDWLTGDLGKQRHLVYEGECFRLGKGMISLFYFSDSFLGDYLYKGLGPSRRMMLHSQVAGILEELYAENIEKIDYQLAWHYECAGEYEKAIKYLKCSVVQSEKKVDYDRMRENIEKIIELQGKGSCEKFFWQLRKINVMRRSGHSGVCQLDRECRILDGWEKEEEYVWMYFYEKWNITMFYGHIRNALKDAENFCQHQVQGMALGIGLLSQGISWYWLGNFLKCRQCIQQGLNSLEQIGVKEGEYRSVGWMYRIWAVFQCGDYEQAEQMCRQFSHEAKKRGHSEDRMFAVLTEIKLAFLDNDMERLEEGLRGAEELKQELEPGRFGNWIELFEGMKIAEDKVWEGLDLLEQVYKNMECGYGITLYGVMVGRITVNKGLCEVFDRCCEEVIAKAEKTGEKAFMGELYLLKQRQTEMTGKKKEAKIWLKKAKECMEESGSWMGEEF